MQHKKVILEIQGRKSKTKNLTQKIQRRKISVLIPPTPILLLNLTYPLRKNLSFPKHLKITQKFTQNCQIVDNVISIGIWRRLKRDRDIGRKAVLSDVKTAFTFTPALSFRISDCSRQ